MAVFVLDASATLPWCFEDEATTATEALLAQLKTGDTALVPAHWPFEIANGLLTAVRRGRISGEKRGRFLTDLRSLPIQIDPESTAEAFDSALALAERYGLTVYDAAYLELAKRRGLPLGSLEASPACTAPRRDMSYPGPRRSSSRDL